MKTVRLTTAAALVRFLPQQFVHRDGVEHRLIHAVAGIFGHGNVAGLGQALHEYAGGDLPFYQPKNEQAMVHMAAAFAKTRARLGTLACTTSVGPGATNMVTGAAGATINRLPVLLLPGDVFAHRLPDPVLQQLEHPLALDVSVNDCFRPVSRLWDRITRPEQLLRALPAAMRVLASPAETGAVTICLPEDVQAEAWDWPEAFFVRRVYDVERRQAGAERVQTAAVWLRTAERPLVIAGGGVHYSQAQDALAQFCARTGIPAALTQAGMGALLDAHPQCVGSIGVTGNAAANALARTADVVLCVGTRLSDFTTASKTLFEHPAVRFVTINVNESDAAKHAALPLCGDARAVLDDLSAALAPASAPGPGRAAYAAAIRTARDAWDRTHAALTALDSPGAPLHQPAVIALLNEFAGPQATVVHAAGGLPGDLHKLWRCRAPQHLHSEYGYSCMGYEIAAALGVKLADPAREVYAMLGDGSYLMLHTELVTAVQEDLKITVVLLDNGGYQCIHGLQRSAGGAGFGNEFRRRHNGRLDGPHLAIDFAANARSLGAAAFTAATGGALRLALEAARAETRPCLIHVPVVPRAVPGSAWWDVPPAAVSSEPDVTRARQAYEQACERRRYWG